MTIHFIVWLCTDSFCWWFDFADWWLSWQVVVKLNMDVELLCNMEMFWWDSFTDPDYGDTCFHCPTGVHSCPEPQSTQGCHFRNQQSQNIIKTWEIYFPMQTLSFIFTANSEIDVFIYTRVLSWILNALKFAIPSLYCVCVPNELMYGCICTYWTFVLSA